MADCVLLVDPESLPNVVALRQELEEEGEEAEVHDKSNKGTVNDPHEGQRGDVEGNHLQDEEPEAEERLLFQVHDGVIYLVHALRSERLSRAEHEAETGRGDAAEAKTHRAGSCSQIDHIQRLLYSFEVSNRRQASKAETSEQRRLHGKSTEGPGPIIELKLLNLYKLLL